MFKKLITALKGANMATKVISGTLAVGLIAGGSYFAIGAMNPQEQPPVDDKPKDELVVNVPDIIGDPIVAVDDEVEQQQTATIAPTGSGVKPQASSVSPSSSTVNKTPTKNEVPATNTSKPVEEQKPVENPTVTPDGQVKPSEEPKEEQKPADTGNPAAYDCGSPNHRCKDEAEHRGTLRYESEPCDWCGSHSCPSYYSRDNEDCPKYNEKTDPTKYCQTCGLPKGDGKNGTCLQFIKDMTCDVCGEDVKAWECHYCK